MSTVAQVVDRVYRDYLYGPDQQPLRARTTTAMTASSTTMTLDAVALASFDERQALAPGVIVEIGMEQMLLSTVNESAITLVRGANGTTATTHAIGDIVTIAPNYARRTVFDAICDEIDDLFPHVYRLVTEELTFGTALPYVEIDDSYEEVRQCYFIHSTEVVPLQGFVRRGLGSTGRVLVTNENVAGTVRATFSGTFVRPAAESESLADLGIELEWERILVVGAAAVLIAGSPELDQMDHNFLSDEIASQNYPPGTAIQISQRLFSLRNNLLERAAARWNRKNRRARVSWVANNQAHL